MGIGETTPLSRLHIVNADTPRAAHFETTNPANTRPVLELNQLGTGKGLLINMNNTGSFQSGLDVRHAGPGNGVYALTSTSSGTAILADNLTGTAILGRSGGATGTSAISGRADSSGNGVFGWCTDNGIGVSALANGSSIAGKFQVNSPNGTQNAVEIITNGLGRGLNVLLLHNNNTARAINVEHNGQGAGVYVTTRDGNALWGIALDIGTAAVLGDHQLGEAVVGRNKGSSGTAAVVGTNDSSGVGVRGFNTKTGIGVLGQNGINGGTGLAAKFENLNANNGSNVLEVVNTANASGISIFATQSSASGSAIVGQALSNNGNGLVGRANTGTLAYGVWGVSSAGFAGYFSGNVNVNGTLSKSAGTFKIDHPLDPGNKYLVHSFVESPDMMNIYNGNITTGTDGRAVVELPAYFEAENIEFRYQLTVVDESRFARARVSRKIRGNQFEITTDMPNVEVSWMVTGIRNDAYARKHRIVPEPEKEQEYKGKYLNPVELGMPLESGIDYEKMKNAGLLDPQRMPVITGMPASQFASAEPAADTGK